jgi:hypothetical protein
MPLRAEQFSDTQQLHGYLDNVPRANYVLAPYFPEDETSDFDFSYELLQSGNGPTAEITALDAAAPITDFEDVKEAFNEVVMIKHGFRINEKRALKYKKPRDDRERQSVFDWVYTKIDEHVQGVWDMVEYMRAQVAYYGKIEYTNDDNDNDIAVTVDYKLNSDQTTVANTPWSEAGSTPLKDLMAATEAYKDQADEAPTAMHMNKTKFQQLMFHDEVRAQLLGSAADSAQMVTREQLMQLLDSLDLPTVVVNEQAVRINGEKRKHVDDGRVVFLAERLGRTMIGPSVQRDYEPGIFGNVHYEGNPPKQSMEVGIAAVPTLEVKNGVHILEA